MEELIESITNNLVNGNLQDALESFHNLNPLQAGYVAVVIMETESITNVNKRWLMNALYNGK